MAGPYYQDLHGADITTLMQAASDAIDVALDKSVRSELATGVPDYAAEEELDERLREIAAIRDDLEMNGREPL